MPEPTPDLVAPDAAYEDLTAVQQRVRALDVAKNLLLSKTGAGPFASAADKVITDGRIFVQDLIELAEYIQTGVRTLEATVELDELPPAYPYEADGHVWLGPDVTTKIGSNSQAVIAGETYLSQSFVDEHYTENPAPTENQES